MADHARKRIRDLAASTLAGLPTTGTRVYAGRTRALPANYDPSLLIYARSEKINRDAHGHPPPLLRVMSLDIVGRVQMADVPDDLLDTIAAEVEAAIYAAAPAFFALDGVGIISMELDSVEIAAKVAEADGRSSEKHSGAVVLSYQVTYRTKEGAPTAFA